MKVRMDRKVTLTLDLRNVGYALVTEDNVRICGVASLSVYRSNKTGAENFARVAIQKDFDALQGFAIAKIKDDNGNIYTIATSPMRFFNIHDAVNKTLTVTEVDYVDIPDD